MDQAVHALMSDLERSGPEVLGTPVRAAVVLAQELGDLFPRAGDRIGLRRRRASAARLARRALSLATEVHGVIADRPDSARAWAFNAREVAKRVDAGLGHAPDDDAAAECVRSAARVAALALALPVLPDEEEWQAEMIAFADENVLVDLHETCLELSTAAIRVAIGDAPAF